MVNNMVKKLTKNEYIKYIIIGLLFMGIIPLNKIGLVQNSVVQTLGSVMFYSVVGIGMNLLLGYSGLVTLGGAGFMGLAAYLSAFFTKDLGWPFLLSMIVSIAVPIAIGIVIGFISLRLEGYYLAIATLGIGEILKQVFIEFEGLTNGFSGKNASYPSLLSFQLDRHQTYLLYAGILILCLIIAHNIVNSATGRAFMAMKGSEPAAQAMGISLLKYKVMAFVISTIFTALAGIMYVHFVKYSYPTTWGLAASLNFLSIVVIGGMQTIIGPVLGSLFVIAVPDLVLKRIPVIGSSPGIAYIFNGIVIILVLLFYNRGLIKLFGDISNKISKRFNGGVEV